MTSIRMEHIIEGYELFKKSMVGLEHRDGNKVFACCGRGESRFQQSIRDIERPFDRFLCTCDIYMSDYVTFCPHLVALIYYLQETFPGFQKLFNKPYETEVLTERAKEMLYE